MPLCYGDNHGSRSYDAVYPYKFPLIGYHDYLGILQLQESTSYINYYFSFSFDVSLNKNGAWGVVRNSQMIFGGEKGN